MLQSEDVLKRGVLTGVCQQIETAPGRLAIVSDDLTLTYGELGSLTDRLATLIREKLGKAAHLSPRPVALLLSNAELAIGMLSVLKAGAFFVPLDPCDDVARLCAALKHSKAELLVVAKLSLLKDEKIRRDLPALQRLSIRKDNASEIPIDEVTTAHAQESLAEEFAAADSWACLLFTSGTTSQPKGVVFDHRALAHMIRDNCNSLDIRHTDHIACLSPSGFIGTTASVLRALVNGATLYPLNLTIKPVAGLAAWLQYCQIDLVQMVPTLFRQMLQSLQPGQTIGGVRLVLLAGEPASRHDLISFQQHFDAGTQLMNELGATETAAIARYYADHTSVCDTTRLPVGRAASDKHFWLRAVSGAAAAPDQVGEIIVTSDYLPLSYTTDIADQRSTLRQSYATGDLGLIDHNGNLIHLGRADSRFKLHGRNIDPVEIEAAILDTGLCRDVTVGLQDLEAAGSQLVAHVPAQSVAHVVPIDAAVTVDRIRDALKSLPQYAIPTRFVFMDRLPIAASGKLLRHALPAPATQRPPLSTEFSPPTSELERQLVQLWAELLSIDTLGINDDFLNLGGDSLLAFQVLDRIAKRYDIELTIAQLLDVGTVAKLAALVQKTSDHYS